MDIIYNWDHFYPLTGEPNGKTLRSAGPCSVRGRRRATSTAMIGPSRDPADINGRSVSKRDPDLHRPQLHELGITHFTLAADGRTSTWPT